MIRLNEGYAIYHTFRVGGLIDGFDQLYFDKPPLFEGANSEGFRPTPSDVARARSFFDAAKLDFQEWLGTHRHSDYRFERDAHESLAIILAMDHDWVGAVRELDAALAGRPPDWQDSSTLLVRCYLRGHHLREPGAPQDCYAAQRLALGHSLTWLGYNVQASDIARQIEMELQR